MYRKKESLLGIVLVLGLILGCWTVAGWAQVGSITPSTSWSLGNRSDWYNWNFFQYWPHRVVNFFGSTNGPTTGANYLVLGIKVADNHPAMGQLPYGLVVTGNPTGFDAPPGIPPYISGPFDFWAGYPIFEPHSGWSAYFNANDPDPGYGTWIGFPIELDPNTLPVNAGPNVQFHFYLGSDESNLWLKDAILGWSSAVMSFSFPEKHNAAQAETLLYYYELPEYAPPIHKMHFPQFPDTTGIDIDFTHPRVLADDWVCTGDGPVSHIRFWFSAKSDWFSTSLQEEITNIAVAIHADIPDPDGDGPLIGMPGEVLWSRDFVPGAGARIQLCTADTQGWYDPAIPEYLADDHLKMFQCDLGDIAAPFIQEEGVVYWLSLSLTTIDDGGPPRLLGWKTADLATYFPGFHDHHFNSDAVWGSLPGPSVWDNLIFPAGPYESSSLDLAFKLSAETDVVGVDNAQGPAMRSSILEQSYPNPFNPSTTIAFELRGPVPVELDVYDVSGRIVRNLLDGEHLSAGRHEVPWDGCDEQGRIMPSGTYVYRLVAGDIVETKRMMLLK